MPTSDLGPRTSVSIGFIGAGNYAGRVLMPAFQKAGANLHTVVSSGGVSAVHFGKKFGFSHAATDAAEVLQNDAINTVVIATRHDTHARFVVEALKAGKHVFVEKPLCLTKEELKVISGFFKHSAEGKAQSGPQITQIDADEEKEAESSKRSTDYADYAEKDVSRPSTISRTYGVNKDAKTQRGSVGLRVEPGGYPPGTPTDPYERD